METDDEDLDALEKEVEAEFNKDMPPEILPPPPHPAQVERSEPALPPVVVTPTSPTPKTPTPSRTPISPTPSDVSGNLASALVGGGGLLPSQLFSPELEKDATDSLNKLTEEEFDKRVEEAKTHPEFQSYCDGMRLELGETGDEPDAWVFGLDEPLIDMVGFLVWVKARENMRKALGVVAPPPPAPAAPKAFAAPAAIAPPEAPKASAPVIAEPEAPKASAPEAPKASAPVIAEPEAPKASAPEAPKAFAAPAIVPTPHTMFFQAGVPVPGPKASAPAIAPPEAPKASAPVIAVPEAPKAAAAPVTEAPGAKAPPPSVPSPSALSTAVDEVVASTATPKPTSTSHRKEYMAFLRAAKNP